MKIEDVTLYLEKSGIDLKIYKERMAGYEDDTKFIIIKDGTIYSDNISDMEKLDDSYIRLPYPETEDNFNFLIKNIKLLPQKKRKKIREYK